jgi:hypothetical protein
MQKLLFLASCVTAITLVFAYPAAAKQCPPGFKPQDGKCVPAVTMSRRAACLSKAETDYRNAKRKCRTHPLSAAAAQTCLAKAKSDNDYRQSQCMLLPPS